MVICDATYHDNPRNFIKDFLKLVFFRSCDGFFCYGQRAMEYLLTYRVPAEKISIRCQSAALPNGYSSSAALERRIEVINACGLLKNILYVGRLAPEKNLNFALEAFRVLAERDPNVQLKIVGEGPERKALELRTCELGLLQNVTFAGSLSGEKLWNEYVHAAALLLPSISEPWGLVVNEALSFGCPVVVSACCGCVPELVIEHVTGYVFDPTNRDDLTQKLSAVISEDFDMKTSAKAAIKLMGSFTPETSARSMYAGLERTVGGLRKVGSAGANELTHSKDSWTR